MKVVAMIPVKLGSVRVPKKNIRPFFDGTPLMTFIQRTCLGCDAINETYIYCSDESVQEYVLPGINFLKRPDYLDGDNMNFNNIFTEFRKHVDADIYVNLHTTAPFSRVETIRDCIEKVQSGEYDSAFCAQNVKTFMWQDDKPLNFDPSHFPRTQDLPDIYAETSVAYVFAKETFDKYKRRVGVKPYIKEVGKIEAIDIDYPEDFDIADAVYRHMKSKEQKKE